jgi:hypothetical protein
MLETWKDQYQNFHLMKGTTESDILYLRIDEFWISQVKKELEEYPEVLMNCAVASWLNYNSCFGGFFKDTGSSLFVCSDASKPRVFLEENQISLYYKFEVNGANQYDTEILISRIYSYLMKYWGCFNTLVEGSLTRISRVQEEEVKNQLPEDYLGEAHFDPITQVVSFIISEEDTIELVDIDGLKFWTGLPVVSLAN